MKINFIVLLIFLPIHLFSQITTSEKNLYSKEKLFLIPDSIFSITFSPPSSSINFSIPSTFNYEKSYLIANKDTLKIYPEEHLEKGELLYSTLIVFKKPVEQIQFYSGNIEGELNIYVNYVPPLKSTSTKIGKKKENARSEVNCIEPYSIPPSIWREGLPAPIVKPAATEVKHIIIHHSAGDNYSSNYTDIVRNIYIFHTKPISDGGRGYDDLGYNFLIAQDGTIFQGRDDQGIVVKDNIQGAHMCAKNRNTMGICLLGNYMEVPPTTAMINSLNDLIAWKMFKENLDPLSYLWHPIANPDRPLQNIAGHRQGCGTNDTSSSNISYTLCPGDYVMALLPQIRKTAFEQTEDCKGIVSSLKKNDFQLNYTATIVNNHLRLSHPDLSGNHISIFDVFGKQYHSSTLSDPTAFIDISNLPQGIYFLSFSKQNKVHVSKFIKE